MRRILACAAVLCCVACSAPIESGTALSREVDGLEVITEQPMRNFFPHQMQYLLLQR